MDNSKNPINQLLQDLLRGVGRGLFGGGNFDKILGMLPKSLSEKSVFRKPDDEEKKKESALQQSLEELGDKLDALTKSLDKLPLAPTGASSTSTSQANKKSKTRSEEKEEEEKEGGGAFNKFKNIYGKARRLFKGGGKAAAEGGEVEFGSGWASKEWAAGDVAAGGSTAAKGAVVAGEGTAAATGGAAVEGASATMGGASAAMAGGPALALLATGFMVATETTIKLTNSLREFSAHLIDTNLQFSQFSGAMSAAQAQIELMKIRMDQIHGAARAGTTLQVGQAAFQTEKMLAPLTDAFANIKGDFATAMNELFQQTIGPILPVITDLMKGSRDLLRLIFFWTDWDKKEREKKDLGEANMRAILGAYRTAERRSSRPGF